MLACSYQPPFCKGTCLVASDHEVVKRPDFHQSQCIFQPAGDGFVGAAGLGNSGRVIVSEDDGRRVKRKPPLHDLPRVDAGPVDGAAKKLFRSDQAVSRIEPEREEDLVLQMPELRFQERLNRLGRVKDRSFLSQLLLCAANEKLLCCGQSVG